MPCRFGRSNFVSTSQREGRLGLRIHLCVDFSTADEVAWGGSRNIDVADPASPNCLH
jgi:hypothetical protein